MNISNIKSNLFDSKSLVHTIYCIYNVKCVRWETEPAERINATFQNVKYGRMTTNYRLFIYWLELSMLSDFICKQPTNIGWWIWAHDAAMIQTYSYAFTWSANTVQNYSSWCVNKCPMHNVQCAYSCMCVCVSVQDIGIYMDKKRGAKIRLFSNTAFHWLNCLS